VEAGILFTDLGIPLELPSRAAEKIGYRWHDKENTVRSGPNNSGHGTILWLVAAVLVLILKGFPVWAHSVNVFAYVDGQKIVVEGYFSGKAKAVDSVVQVFDADGTKIHEGKTDSNGVYSFNRRELGPIKSDLRIVLQAGIGHQAEYSLSAGELPASWKQESIRDDIKKIPPSRQVSSGAASGDVLILDRELLKGVLEEVVDARIQPVATMLSQQQKLLVEYTNKGPTMSEVLGGIGWIIGIAGVAAYLMSRKPEGK